MKIFQPYLDEIVDDKQRERVYEILNWIHENYPSLEPRIAWNQPMFTDHGTYIIGFSISKQHVALSPELAGIVHFSEEIINAGYDHTKMLMKIRWDQRVPYDLLKQMIEYNVLDKKEISTFWRK